MKRSQLIIVFSVLALVLAGGLFVPLGSYVSTQGICPDGDGPPSVSRLHLIKGGTIQKVKDADVQPDPSAGCARQVKYVLYLL